MVRALWGRQDSVKKIRSNKVRVTTVSTSNSRHQRWPSKFSKCHWKWRPSRCVAPKETQSRLCSFISSSSYSFCFFCFFFYPKRSRSNKEYDKKEKKRVELHSKRAESYLIKIPSYLSGASATALLLARTPTSLGRELDPEHRNVSRAWFFLTFVRSFLK